MLTALIALIEAMAVALAVFALIAIPTLLIWWRTFDLAADPANLIGTVSSLWQLAHLIPLSVAIDAKTALSLGVGAEPLQFVVTMAPLGLTLITTLLGFRSGWRFASRGVTGAWAILGGALGFGGAAWFVGVWVTAPESWPAWASILVPALVYTVAVATAVLLRAALEGEPWWQVSVRWLQRHVQRFAPIAAGSFAERAAETFRLIAGAGAALMGLAALGVSLSLLVNYVDVVTLSQSLQLDALAALMLFLMQLVLLPIAWIWGLSWLAGSGFSVGVATSVSPFEALLGPLPALPLFGALPEAWGWAGALAPALVVALGATIGAASAGRPVLRRGTQLTVVAITLSAAVVIGLLVVGASALASGSIGPGRFAQAGPDPWLTGALVALEMAFGMPLGAFARRLDFDRVREALPAVPLLPGVKRTADESEVDTPRDEFDTVPLTPLSPLISPKAEPDQISQASRDVSPHESGGELRHVPDEPEVTGDELLRAYSWETGQVDEPLHAPHASPKKGIGRFLRSARATALNFTRSMFRRD